MNSKNIQVRVHSSTSSSSSPSSQLVWNCQGTVTSHQGDDLVIECFLDDVITNSTVFAPRTPDFRAVVYDTQSWGTTPRANFPTLANMIASDDEEEETQPQPAAQSDDSSVFDQLAQPAAQSTTRKRGRPRGSRNRDRHWLPPTQRRPMTEPTRMPRPPCSAAIVALNLLEGNVCEVCCEDEQMLLKCSNTNCKAYLCIKCIERIERRFGAKCPYCTTIF